MTLVVGAAMVIVFMMYTGMLDRDSLLNVFAGEVEMGETEHAYTEAEFVNVFDIIMGEMEVSDTSKTEFKRARGFGCNAAYVVTETQSVVKYQVKSSPDMFFVDVENKTYYVSPNLGVSYHEADKRTRTFIEESNCIKEKNIKPEDIDRSKTLAERNFTKSIERSDKWKNAQARFVVIKEQLLDKLTDAGFTEVGPSVEPILN